LRKIKISQNFNLLRMDTEKLQEENIRLQNELLALKAELEKVHNKMEELQIKNRKADELIRDFKNKKTSNLTTGAATSRRFKMVTVLYANITGFSELENTDDAELLIDELDELFRQFDSIVDNYNIKKVKSLGDTYMCAGGMPHKNRTNPVEVVLAAFEILMLLEEMKKNEHGRIWNISLGIHTGPVNATISGKKKNIYELKGDAANIASRIEGYATPGRLIVSEMTHEFIRDYFICDKIGGLPVKYTGVVDMYEVVGLKPKYSDDDLLIEPNNRFKVRFGHIRFGDLEEYILNRLEEELPSYLYYHNVKHTMDVVIGVEVIGTAEGVSEEELLLLKTAALFHDMGQIVQSPGHEEISCKFAREILPKYSYVEEEIDIICSIIMATQLPPNPQNLLERIICDADLDYLGRSDFIPVSDTLYDELHHQGILTNKNDWNHLQVKFISNHSYFTDFAKNNREVNKQGQIDRLKSILK